MTFSVEPVLDHELRFDQRPVPGTGFDALDPELWQPLLSFEEAADPVTSLERMAVLAMDGLGIRRATVTGVLLCARRPDRWLRNARITAIRYHGIDRTTRQVDVEEITGPLPRQISQAVNFCVRNMLVAARKTPMRIDMPQYSSRAIFEAVVNAVAHRDYSMRCSRIRISMFSNRLEVQSPGRPHRLRLEWIDGRCTTRNQAIASRLGWMDVGNVPGSGNRRYIMERRGDGVPSIIRETRKLTGLSPEYGIIDDSELLLRIPAAPGDATPARVRLTVTSDGRRLPGAEVMALFPDGSGEHAVVGETGAAAIDLYTATLPMTLFCAAPGHSARLVRDWLPSADPGSFELAPLPRGGSVILEEGEGRLPGLNGVLNVVHDERERTYLDAWNITVDEGRIQPVRMVPGRELHLADSGGRALLVQLVWAAGRSVLFGVPGGGGNAMIRVYTDAELRDLRLLPKKVTNPGARWSVKSGRQAHKQRTFLATGTASSGQRYDFQVYQRQTLDDQRDYSCGIRVLPRGGPPLMLARYNGDGHRHEDIWFRPHIHRATEAAIIAGKSPEHEAQATTRFETLAGALACLIEDYMLSGISAEPDQPSLFNDPQS